MTAHIALAIPGGMTTGMDVDIGSGLGQFKDGGLHILDLEIADPGGPLHGIPFDFRF